MVSLIDQVDRMAGLTTVESAGQLPGVMPWGISALSHVKAAHRIWKKCTKIELITKYPKLAMAGVGFEEGKGLLSNIPLVGSAITSETAANWVVRTEIVAMAVVNCVKQKKAFLVAIQHFKDAVQLKKEMPVGFRPKEESIEQAAPRHKATWLFAPSTSIHMPNNMKLMVWRVGQITESTFFLIAEGVKLLFCYLDVKDALDSFQNDEKLKEEKQYIFVYGAYLHQEGWQVFQTTFKYIKETKSEQYSELKNLNVDSAITALAGKFII